MDAMMMIGAGTLGFVCGVVADRMKTLNAERRTLNAERKPVAALTEEEVRKVERCAHLDGTVRDCVAWIVRDVRTQAQTGAAESKPADGGYPFALARLAGMMYACDLVERVWTGVCDGSMADGLKAEREEQEKGERTGRRGDGRGEGRGEGRL